MAGKVCVVTGANTGIGRVTALELARAGAEVVLMCRSREKTEPVVEEIRRETNAEVSFEELDLASLVAVKASAERWLAKGRPLHVLINNAGLAAHRGTTEDGFEIHFGVNHLGHFLLTKLLEPRLRESAPSRVVNVASIAHYKADKIDYDAMQRPTATRVGMHEYRVSKLANVLYTVQLARHLENSGVTTYALHPGVVASDVWRKVPWPIRPVMKMFMVTNEEGAKTTLHCAMSEEAALESGLYYDKCQVRPPNPVVRDLKMAETLWAKSEEFVLRSLAG